jgi:hypothetical protein
MYFYKKKAPSNVVLGTEALYSGGACFESGRRDLNQETILAEDFRGFPKYLLENFK